MRIETGHFGDVSLDGLHFAGTVWWPGRMDEGNRWIQRAGTGAWSGCAAMRPAAPGMAPQPGMMQQAPMTVPR